MFFRKAKQLLSKSRLLFRLFLNVSREIFFNGTRKLEPDKSDKKLSFDLLTFEKKRFSFPNVKQYTYLLTAFILRLIKNDRTFCDQFESKLDDLGTNQSL